MRLQTPVVRSGSAGRRRHVAVMQRKLPPPAAPPAAPRANKRDLRWISPRALTPAAVQTFRGVISRPKETIRSIRTGSTDIDRTVQTTMWIGATADPTSPVRQELHLQSCEQPDVVRGGRPLIVGWYSFGPEHWPPHRSRRCRCQSPLSIRLSLRGVPRHAGQRAAGCGALVRCSFCMGGCMRQHQLVPSRTPSVSLLCRPPRKCCGYRRAKGYACAEKAQEGG